MAASAVMINLYRVIMQADPVADALRSASYGKNEPSYEDLMDMASLQ